MYRRGKRLPWSKTCGACGIHGWFIASRARIFWWLMITMVSRKWHHGLSAKSIKNELFLCASFQENTLHVWKSHFADFIFGSATCSLSEIESWERAKLPDLSCSRPLQTAKFPAVVSAVVKPRLENCLCPRDQRHIRIDLLQRQPHFTNGGENDWSPPSRYRASCHKRRFWMRHGLWLAHHSAGCEKWPFDFREPKDPSNVQWATYLK